MGMNKKKKNNKLSRTSKLTEAKENFSHSKSLKKHIDLSFFRWNEKKLKEKLDKQ
jgi:hypothetical protein